MEMLPFEVAKKIFEYLELIDIIRCENVCRLWFLIIRSILSRFAFKISGRDDVDKYPCELTISTFEDMENVRLQRSNFESVASISSNAQVLN